MTNIFNFKSIWQTAIFACASCFKCFVMKLLPSVIHEDVSWIVLWMFCCFAAFMLNFTLIVYMKLIFWLSKDATLYSLFFCANTSKEWHVRMKSLCHWDVSRENTSLLSTVTASWTYLEGSACLLLIAGLAFTLSSPQICQNQLLVFVLLLSLLLYCYYFLTTHV